MTSIESKVIELENLNLISIDEIPKREKAQELLEIVKICVLKKQ